MVTVTVETSGTGYRVTFGLPDGESVGLDRLGQVWDDPDDGLAALVARSEIEADR